MFLGFRNKAYLNLIKFDLGSPKHRNSQNVIKTIFLCYLSVFKDHDNTVKVSSHYFCLVSRTDFSMAAMLVPKRKTPTWQMQTKILKILKAKIIHDVVLRSTIEPEIVLVRSL